MRASTMRFSRLRTGLVLSGVAASAVAFPPGTAHAQTFLPDFSQTTVATTGGATQMTFAPDGRIFVSEQGGNLRVIKDGALLATPFLTAPGINSSGERGLLGVAFDPNFAVNNYVYAYYTHDNGSQVFNRLSRFTANGDVAVAGSETVLMEFNPLSTATNHNGGAVHFGLDGKLYVAVGDNANGSNAQSLNTRLGKIIRLNSDGTIPTDNPYFNDPNVTGLNKAIWASGLRNPYTMAFQPGTGTLYINDVGEGSWEEVNVGAAGANYGWPGAEGPNGNGPGVTAPFYAYQHGTGPDQGNSIAGGAFYNPTSLLYPSEFVGDYFYADFVRGWIRRLDAGTANSFSFASGLGNITDLRVGADGAVYYLARTGGASSAVRRIGFTAAVAVPEPSAGLLTLLGLTAGGVLLRRRSRK